MLLGGRRKTETWVHSFSVGSETRKYKGFTIYRITSIVGGTVLLPVYIIGLLHKGFVQL